MAKKKSQIIITLCPPGTKKISEKEIKRNQKRQKKTSGGVKSRQMLK